MNRASLAARVEHDLQLTRALLGELPDNADTLTWQPHERVFSLGGLADHLAQLPHWGVRIVTGDGYDLARSTGHPRVCSSTLAAILETFDRHAAEWRSTMAAVSDLDLDAPWHLRRGTEVIEAMTRGDAAERYVLHHMIHHRGQMTVYLRLAGLPVPPLYGPTGYGPP